MTCGVSWRDISAGQSMFTASLDVAQKHPLTCGDAPPKILSNPPTADSAVSREFFLWAREKSPGGRR